MADIAKVNSVEWDDLAGVSGVAKAAIGKMGGTIDAPAGASVTEAASLVHWWKMNDSASTQTDSVINDPVSNLTGVNADLVSSGRTVGGSAINVIGYNPTSGDAYSKAADALVDFEGTPKSWSFWLKLPDNPSSGYKGITGCTSNGSWYDGFYIYIYGGYLRFGVADTGTSYRWYQYSRYAKIATTALTGDNDWHYITCVLDDAAGFLQVYIDGTAGSAASNPMTTAINAGDWQYAVGALFYATSSVAYHTDMEISDYRIYSVALDATQIAAIYNDGDGDWDGT